MNLLLLDPTEVDADGLVRLEQRRAEHLLKVLGVEPGQRVRAGMVDGPVGRAQVLETTKRSVTLCFQPGVAPDPDADLESDPEAGRTSLAAETKETAEASGTGEVDLVVGLPRPQVLHRVLQTCSAMSVRRLDLVNAWRVEKSFFQSPSLSDEKIRYQLLLGAEQGMSTRLPKVHRQPLLVPFLRSAQDDADVLRLLAHPDADLDLETAFWRTSSGQRSRAVQIAIGPEGGWIDREVETFVAAGFRPVRLGGWILRVEVAVAVALGQLAVARRQALNEGRV